MEEIVRKTRNPPGFFPPTKCPHPRVNVISFVSIHLLFSVVDKMIRAADTTDVAIVSVVLGILVPFVVDIYTGFLAVTVWE